MVEEDGNDWIEYFGIDQETIEDIWEDEREARSWQTVLESCLFHRKKRKDNSCDFIYEVN